MKISICIPIYNAEKYLSSAIQSVLNQTYKDYELILLNDGSNDASLNIMNKFAQSDNRIKVINDGLNKGLVFRLNQSVNLAKGEYYVRMDADDIMFPERLEKQIEAMCSDDDIALVHSAAVSINAENEVLGIKININPERYKTSIAHPTVMARRSFFLENPYDKDFSQMEDLELWHRTSPVYKFAYIPEPLLFYREDSGLVSVKHKKMYPGLKRFCEKYKIKGWKRAKILIFSLAKRVIYRLLEMLNLSSFLIHQRFMKISAEEQKKFKDILEKSVNGRI